MYVSSGAFPSIQQSKESFIMKSIKQVFSYALILAMTSQLFIPLAKAAESSPATAIEEIERLQHEVASEPQTTEPSRAERKFFKKFDRKFKRFSDDVYEM